MVVEQMTVKTPWSLGQVGVLRAGWMKRGRCSLGIRSPTVDTELEVEARELVLPGAAEKEVMLDTAVRVVMVDVRWWFVLAFMVAVFDLLGRLWLPYGIRDVCSIGKSR